ncbi:MAG: septal ring lytic transglycosylase RlpA family protein, partial [Treponema sp.]|nr:septal ring lytic transglycosylase RlpA family protein [Treponema sp.]
PTGENFRQEGIASWYGPQFEGRPTASGEIFNSAHFTAAHPTLPFGTFLLVTNRNNNRQVSVRVNDRGPFIEGRIIDVSQAAAEHLGMIVTGTAPVIIETIPSSGQWPPPPAQPPVQPPPPVFMPPPVQHPPQTFVQPPVQQQEPVHVSTTTIPAEVPPNVPITINIFHTPNDPTPTVVVVPAIPDTAAVPQEPAVTFVQNVQPQPERIIVPVQPAPIAEPVAVVPSPRVLPPPPAEQHVIIQPTPQPVVIVEEWPPAQQAATPPPPIMPAGPPPVVRVPAITADPNSTYRIQVSSFREPRYAVGTVGRLREAGLEARAYPIPLDGNPFFRVVLEGVRGTEVQSTVGRLAVMGFYGVIVTRE